MGKKKRITIGSVVRTIILFLLVFLTFFPLLLMINMSLKQNVMIANDFFGLPRTIYWTNYMKAFRFIFRPILNSLLVCGTSLVGILMVVSLSGYAFGRMKFKGKKVLYSMVLAVMMIPYALTIIPNYGVVVKLGLLNSFWALIIPYISGQQIFGIILAEAFFHEMPGELFEAARIDGAGDLQQFLRIGLPLSKPILITVGIQVVVAMYNDYMWPSVVITGGDDVKTFCQIVLNNAAGKGSSDLGLITAAFILGTIPLLIITQSCLKYYIQGMMVGAVKG
ncbi:MAG: carbohydrate ABC transporter permease [Lachnospiraceae bacterium]|jgi:ABC-type glycerol-3-phosphate transport system permease component|nr:carbohydrate ABC transporter permease [uncultured Acetatifactor sp.]MCI9229711.1 carbohydrate ABC transporter permease [Lachnospiraceae bacterium]MCI9571779.1 carbohydrate ABC transporter permease [Lachnospiraceae bacterium]